MIFRQYVSDQKRTARIMFFHILEYRLAVIVGIAVPAEMHAGIIRTDITAQQT